MHILGQAHHSRAKHLDEIAKKKDLNDWNKIKPQKKDEESNRTLDATKNLVFLAFIYLFNIVIGQ
jgi:hypothetical protein